MIRSLHFASLGLTFLILAARGGTPAPPPSQPVTSVAPGEQLTRLVERYWDEYLLLNPQKLPQGAATRYEDGYGYNISSQFLADSLALERRYLSAVLAVPRPRLDAESQLTYDIFKRERELAIEGFTYPFELLPINPVRSMPLLFAQTGAGVGQYAILSAKDYENWQIRTDDYVRWTKDALANLREGMRRGYSLPRVLVEEMLPSSGRSGRGHIRQHILSTAPSHPCDLGGFGTNPAHRRHKRRGKEQNTAVVPCPSRLLAQRISASGQDQCRAIRIAAGAVLVCISGQERGRQRADACRNPCAGRRRIGTPSRSIADVARRDGVPRQSARFRREDARRPPFLL